MKTEKMRQNPAPGKLVVIGIMSWLLGALGYVVALIVLRSSDSINSVYSVTQFLCTGGGVCLLLAIVTRLMDPNKESGIAKPKKSELNETE